MSQFQPDTHSKTIGYLLWIFGFTGAHRFYYGKPITGVLWFLTLGLAGIGWLIDLFLIPGMDRRADLRFTAGRYDYSVAWLLQTFLGLLGIHRLYAHHSLLRFVEHAAALFHPASLHPSHHGGAIFDYLLH